MKKLVAFLLVFTFIFAFSACKGSTNETTAAASTTAEVTTIPGETTTAATTLPGQSTYKTGDIITFGSYPQTKVESASLIAALNAQTLQAGNTVIYGGSKYKRVYFPRYTTGNGGTSTKTADTFQDNNGYFVNTVYWFKFEPVYWRVLSNTNGALYVMAEKILDSKAFSQVRKNVTWEACTLRTWLNNDFYNTAFNSSEQAKIKTSNVVNSGNPWYGSSGGNRTKDKLFLLSYADTINPAYGFSSSYDTFDTARQAQGTDYAKSSGLHTNSFYSGYSYWWLRSPGLDSDFAGIVNINGCLYFYDDYVNYTYIGVRPAFRINL